MRRIVSFFLSITSCTFICASQNTTILYNMDNCTVSESSSFDPGMMNRHGYYAGELEICMIEQGDTTCLLSSVGVSQFLSSTTETTSEVVVYCWPSADTRVEKYSCEDEPRADREYAELVMKFHFEADEPLTCSASFCPENNRVADSFGHDLDSLIAYPHLFVDNLYEIVCGMLCQGKEPKDVESFLDTFDKRLDSSMLEVNRGYGVEFGSNYGYSHYKYTYYLLKALLKISGTPYEGKEIAELNKDLNRFYMN